MRVGIHTQQEKNNLFFFLLLLFVISILILTLANSFIIVFLGWEGLGVTSFLLIIFYQNWIRFKGGLLTLLTNRIGDAIILLCFAYRIILRSIFNLRFFLRFTWFFLFIILTFTKSAQVPFTRWLPAAIAAPTPVRALVHRSTLVTAGIWLLVRFRQLTLIINLLKLIFGILTLIVARFAALVEIDGKKIIALSTLSQLGLIVFTLFIGGVFISFLHLCIHALGKANLFIIIGNYIHSHFSQQDVRFITPGGRPIIYLLSTSIRIFSLTGVIMTSGFFSKDSIFITQFRLLNRIFSNLILLSIVRITMIYCFKLLGFLSKISETRINLKRDMRLYSFTSSGFLSLLRLIIGIFIFFNIKPFFIWISKISSFYWLIFFLTGIFYSFNLKINFGSLFILQRFFIRYLN